ncbi:glucokinase [Halotalea alkalilenta]|uniref:Glucokinase n=1 Tax=Halotalea alkalilenta TaxID=376489 RepID=A0A172YCS7_9GAMM|nr:glucokinase [Halotalea alkalilenta]ANF57061.1 glucokinase [Halotalea alkalilenta]
MTRPALVGDIGGTNARFALVTPGEFDLSNIQALKCADYPSLSDAVRTYLDGIEGPAPKEACLAFACPVHKDVVKMTNNPWSFSKSAFKREFELDNFKAINDFTAMALGLPHIRPDDLHQLGQGSSAEGCARLVMGPGTGLGVAGLAPSQRFWIPLSAEGGHASFAPTDDFEMKLLEWFRARYDRVSIERMLCGQGLVDLYHAHAEFDGLEPHLSTPAEVTGAALEGDPLALETVMRFCRILGHVAGDIALTLGARGGVYLCGGILPRILALLDRSDFREAFADKGRMGYYTAEIATWVVTAKWTGLLGAAEALHNEEVA